jgi:hypothetical protein
MEKHLTSAELENLLPSDWPRWYLLQEYYKRERAAAESRARHTRFVMLNSALVTTLVVALFVTTNLWLGGICK